MKRFLRNLLLLCLVLALGLSVAACSRDDGEETASGEESQEQDDNEEHDHDHDDEEEGIGHHHDIPYEWSGIFEIEAGAHTIKFNENEGDESILVAFISADGGITDMEHHAAHVMEAEAIDVDKDGNFTAENEYTYKLELNNETAEFEFEMETPGGYYVFTEHLPEEFNMEILNSEGEVLEADSSTEYEGDHDHDH